MEVKIGDKTWGNLIIMGASFDSLVKKGFGIQMFNTSEKESFKNPNFGISFPIEFLTSYVFELPSGLGGIPLPCNYLKYNSRYEKNENSIYLPEDGEGSGSLTLFYMGKNQVIGRGMIFSDEGLSSQNATSKKLMPKSLTTDGFIEFSRLKYDEKKLKSLIKKENHLNSIFHKLKFHANPHLLEILIRTFILSNFTFQVLFTGGTRPDGITENSLTDDIVDALIRVLGVDNLAKLTSDYKTSKNKEEIIKKICNAVSEAKGRNINLSINDIVNNRILAIKRDLSNLSPEGRATIELALNRTSGVDKNIIGFKKYPNDSPVNLLGIHFLSLGDDIRIHIPEIEDKNDDVIIANLPNHYNKYNFNLAIENLSVGEGYHLVKTESKLLFLVENEDSSKAYVKVLKKAKKPIVLKAYEEMIYNKENLSFVKYIGADNDYLVFKNFNVENKDVTDFFALKHEGAISYNSEKPSLDIKGASTIDAESIMKKSSDISPESKSFGLVLKYKLLKLREGGNKNYIAGESPRDSLKDAPSYDGRFYSAPKDLELTVVFFWGESATKFIYSNIMEGT